MRWEIKDETKNMTLDVIGGWDGPQVTIRMRGPGGYCHLDHMSSEDDARCLDVARQTWEGKMPCECAGCKVCFPGDSGTPVVAKFGQSRAKLGQSGYTFGSVGSGNRESCTGPDGLAGWSAGGGTTTGAGCLASATRLGSRRRGRGPSLPCERAPTAR